jgi:hypothetical protein
MIECPWIDQGPCLAFPALVKGKLILPPRLAVGRLEAAAARTSERSPWLRFEEASVLCRSSGKYRFLVLPRVEARALIEHEPHRLARDLYNRPFADVLQYIAGLREALREYVGVAGGAGDVLTATSFGDGGLSRVLLDVLPALFDPVATGVSIDRELAHGGIPGRHFLDGWVEMEPAPVRGMTGRLADRFFDPQLAGSGMCVRATPTRQLHITAGNSPVVSVLSFLRAVATKGAPVIKSASDALLSGALLAAAMQRLDPDHPITRHASVVYWQGGDRAVEDVLFSDRAFDRVVVWGSREALTSLAPRLPRVKTIFHEPRYGVSMIGREALPRLIEEAAVLATSDSLIGNQHDCTSSLVHYVEGAEHGVLEYCHALQRVLARWDEQLPHRASPVVQGALRRMRRGELLDARWFPNTSGNYITSAVVYTQRSFHLTSHPMGRIVVVRRVDDLSQVLPHLSSAVSTVGIFPEERRIQLRDCVAAAGVSNVHPLGECERSYGGVPHDGMRVLSELVNWVNG